MKTNKTRANYLIYHPIHEQEKNQEVQWIVHLDPFEFISFSHCQLQLNFDRSYSIDFSMNPNSIQRLFLTKQKTIKDEDRNDFRWLLVSKVDHLHRGNSLMLVVQFHNVKVQN